jgi:hypothetical protein
MECANTSPSPGIEKSIKKDKIKTDRFFVIYCNIGIR